MQFENVKVGKQYKITMSYGLRGIFKEGDIVTVKEKALGTSKQRMEEDLHDIVNDVINNIFKEVQ